MQHYWTEKTLSSLDLLSLCNNLTFRLMWYRRRGTYESSLHLVRHSVIFCPVTEWCKSTSTLISRCRSQCCGRGQNNNNNTFFTLSCHMSAALSMRCPCLRMLSTCLEFGVDEQFSASRLLVVDCCCLEGGKWGAETLGAIQLLVQLMSLKLSQQSLPLMNHHHHNNNQKYLADHPPFPLLKQVEHLYTWTSCKLIIFYFKVNYFQQQPTQWCTTYLQNQKIMGWLLLMISTKLPSSPA